MYQIAICDDEKIFTDKLAHMIKQYSNAHHHVIDLHLFQQAADFIQSSLESYDIVFLDVRFGEICPHTRFAGQKNNLYNGKG